MLDVAIIGAGRMGRWHLAAAKAAGCRVVAIVDLDPAAAAKLGRRAPGAKLTTEISQLSALSVQVAHICSPTAQHAETAIAVAELGIAAFVEKPIAPDSATTQRLLDAAQRADVLVCPAHQYAFQTGVEAAAKALGRLGKLRRINLEFFSAGAENGAIAPDALIEEILPHPISIVQRMRPDVPVAQLSWSIATPSAGELMATAEHDGVMISMFVSTHGRPTRVLTQLFCDRGSIEIDGFHGYAAVLPGGVSRISKLAAPFSRAFRHLGGASVNLAARALRREFAYPGLQNLTRRFYGAVARRDRSACPIAPQTIASGALARDVLSASLRAARPPETAP